MAIGRPLSLTPNVATKNISADATANQTEFTVTGGYRINEIAVYRNGVRLAQGRDFTASDGSTVNLVNGATINDVIEFSIFDSFNVADAIVSAASSQNVNGDLNVTGKLYGGTVDTDSLNIGVGTFGSTIHVGTAFTVDASGNTNTVGMITAASFSGSGANLTGVASTDNILTGTAATFRNTAVSAGVPNVNIVGLATVGIITAYGAAELSSTVAVGGVVTLTDTTDATSTSTGALIISGGVGIAKSLHVGQNISVGGTLTYEDVTNVDSIGLVTARSGVNVSGGQLLVGSGITMGIAGVATFSGTSDVHLLDNVQLKLGDGSDFYFYHDGSASKIINTQGTLTINAGASEAGIDIVPDGAINLYHNNLKKFETSATGATITGEATATAGLIVGTALTIGSAGLTTFSGDVDFSGVTASMVWDRSDDALEFADNVEANWGSSSDLKIYHSSSNAASYIQNSQGNLFIEAPNSSAVKLRKNGTAETMLVATAGGSCELYEDNTKRLETTTSGVTVTGSVTATNYLGDGSALTGIGGDMDITSSLFV